MDFRSLKSKRSSRLSSNPSISTAFLSPSSRENHGLDTSSPVPSWENQTFGGMPSVPENNPSTSETREEAPATGEYQSHIWGTVYTSVPPALKIRVTKETGRGLYSQTSFRPGDPIITLHPRIAVLSTGHLGSYCSTCCSPAQKGSPLKRCTMCKVVMYCDKICQERDWPQHKEECVALKDWVNQPLPEGSSDNSEVGPPNDAIRSLARILWTKVKLGMDSIFAKEIDAMQSHRSTQPSDPRGQGVETMTRIAHGLIQYMGLKSPQDLEPFGIRSAADLVDLVSRFTSNTFALASPSLSPLGACVSPLVALINHSCDPNAVVVFPRSSGSKEHEPLLQVVAIKPIQDGEEILASYVDTTQPRHLRRQALKETYHFVCKCTLCVPKGKVDVDLREAMYCPKRCGGVCLLPSEQDSQTSCLRCNALLRDPDPVLDILRIGQEGLEKAEKVQFSDPQKALQLTTNLVPLLVSAGLTPGAHPLLALTRLHATFLIEQFAVEFTSDMSSDEDILSPALQGANGQGALEQAQITLNNAIRFSTRSFTGLSQILTYGHPVRGVSLAELGKLLAVDEPKPQHAQESSTGGIQLDSSAYPPSGPARLKLSHETLIQALQELKVGFGSGKGMAGGETGQEVRKMIVDVEKELSVWKDGVKNALQNQIMAQRSGPK